MDLALGLTSPVRRNSKMELPLSVYKRKTYDNSVPILFPMENDSSSMIDSGTCRITRWVYPQCGSSFNYMQKSSQFSRSGTALQKIMLPKEPTLAISISQQTIVGGFVGSKTYAGRSMFADSSQIWDAVVCKFVELMSLVKEKPNSVAPKSKLPSPDSCVASIDCYKNSQVETFRENICDSKSLPCSSSIKCVPRNYRVSKLTDATNRVPQHSSHCAPIECKAVVLETKELSLNSSMDIVPPHRGTYSSVVDGTFKSESARSGSCTMVTLNQKEQLPEAFPISLPHAPLQSYADVAKLIPNKQMARPNKSGCDIAQNLKNMWNCRIKRNKINQDKKVVNCQGTLNKDLSEDDVLSNGDTRWKGDWKSKRAKFQRSCPIAVPTNISSSWSSETSEENSINESITKEASTDPGSECKWTMDEREPTCTLALKEGLRGRHPSECSLDSEDSFVIFEECPDAALATSSRVPIDPNSSLEECESEEDYNSSSSDDSDYEDDDVDSGQQLLKFCLSSNSCVKEDCNWLNECSAQTVPEKYKGKNKKKVHFAEGSCLAVIRPMIAWGYAYRESRRGPWEVHARDRVRFQCRIASMEAELSAILHPLHRQKVMESRLHDL